MRSPATSGLRSSLGVRLTGTSGRMIFNLFEEITYLGARWRPKLHLGGRGGPSPEWTCHVESKHGATANRMPDDDFGCCARTTSKPTGGVNICLATRWGSSQSQGLAHRRSRRAGGSCYCQPTFPSLGRGVLPHRELMWGDAGCAGGRAGGRLGTRQCSMRRPVIVPTRFLPAFPRGSSAPFLYPRAESRFPFRCPPGEHLLIPAAFSQL